MVQHIYKESPTAFNHHMWINTLRSKGCFPPPRGLFFYVKAVYLEPQHTGIINLSSCWGKKKHERRWPKIFITWILNLITQFQFDYGGFHFAFAQRRMRMLDSLTFQYLVRNMLVWTFCVDSLLCGIFKFPYMPGLMHCVIFLSRMFERSEWWLKLSLSASQNLGITGTLGKSIFVQIIQ